MCPNEPRQAYESHDDANITTYGAEASNPAKEEYYKNLIACAYTTFVTPGAGASKTVQARYC